MIKIETILLEIIQFSTINPHNAFTSWGLIALLL